MVVWGGYESKHQILAGSLDEYIGIQLVGAHIIKDPRPASYRWFFISIDLAPALGIILLSIIAITQLTHYT